MAEKIGVYICAGCEIGQKVDTEQLAAFVKNKHGGICPVIKTNPFLCGPEAISAIKADIAESGLDGVLIAACSPRVKTDIFKFADNFIIERVNLRENVVWSFTDPSQLKDGTGAPVADQPEELKIIAQDYLNMGVIKINKTAQPAPEIPETCKTIMVIGGGNTGLSAALDAAKLGYDVVLIEKENELGGFAAKMYKKIPSCHPWTTSQPVGVEEKIKAVKANAKIKVFTGASVEKLSGAPGIYKAELSNGTVLDIGSVVMAAGFKPYDATPLDYLGYGKFKNVITNVDMEAMAKKGQILRPSDGKPARSVAFIQCAGQRSDKEGHLPYCSNFCCANSLKQAAYVREKDENAKAFVFYRDMITPGVYEHYYKAAQDDPGIFLTKGEVAAVKEDSDKGLLLTVTDTLLGQEIEVKADVVVLAIGIIPTTLTDPVMNFQYRQGPSFPDLELFNGFADSNYICFPYETRRTGVYAAGCVRQPMLMGDAENDAAGAVLKAAQCISSINRGMAVHPRSGDLSYPKFNLVRCTQCKRCTEECPFGALDEDEKSNPMPNPTRCRRCGTCMGACPERVISFDNYHIDMIGSMIRDIKVPEDLKVGGPRALVLVCENDAYPALDLAAFRGRKWNPYVRMIPVRCLGSVNAIWIADAMSKGMDGVLLMGCKYGEDYQCHFVKGSELCSRRMVNIGETLGRLGVEVERVRQVQLAIDEYDKVPEVIEDFMEMLGKFGPNPFKGY